MRIAPTLFIALTVCIGACNSSPGTGPSAAIDSLARQTTGPAASEQPTAPPLAPTVTSSASRCAAQDVRPSALAALSPAAKLAGFGDTTLTFEGQLVRINADIDSIPFEVPPRFREVYARSPTQQVFIVDLGADGNVVTSSGGIHGIGAPRVGFLLCPQHVSELDPGARPGAFQRSGKHGVPPSDANERLSEFDRRRGDRAVQV